jgi:hypothetical protein
MATDVDLVPTRIPPSAAAASGLPLPLPLSSVGIAGIRHANQMQFQLYGTSPPPIAPPQQRAAVYLTNVMHDRQRAMEMARVAAQQDLTLGMRYPSSSPSLNSDGIPLSWSAPGRPALPLPFLPPSLPSQTQSQRVGVPSIPSSPVPVPASTAVGVVPGTNAGPVIIHHHHHAPPLLSQQQPQQRRRPRNRLDLSEPVPYSTDSDITSTEATLSPRPSSDTDDDNDDASLKKTPSTATTKNGKKNDDKSIETSPTTSQIEEDEASVAAARRRVDERQRRLDAGRPRQWNQYHGVNDHQKPKPRHATALGPPVPGNGPKLIDARLNYLAAAEKPTEFDAREARRKKKPSIDQRWQKYQNDVKMVLLP